MIVLGRNNLHGIPLYDGGARRSDLSGITRWIAHIGALQVDSADNPTAFDWTNYEDSGGDLLALNFRSISGLTAGVYPLRLTYCDELNPAGVEYPRVFRITVRGRLEGAVEDEVPVGTITFDGSSTIFEEEVEIFTP